MQNNSIIDMDDPITKYCVSAMTGMLSQIGLGLHVRSWNHLVSLICNTTTRWVYNGAVLTMAFRALVRVPGVS